MTEAGRYRIGDPFPIPVTVTLPAGWNANVGGPYAAFFGNGLRDVVTITRSQSFFSDPCNGGPLLDPQPGSTVDDLTTALATLPGFTATTPTTVTVDGYPGKQIRLTAPDSFAGCTLSADGYQFIQLPLGSVIEFAPGERMDLWILDVNGERIVVTSAAYPGQSEQEQVEARDVVDSIQIGNVN